MRACARQSKHNTGGDIDKIVDALLQLRASERSLDHDRNEYLKPVAEMGEELYPTPRGSAMIAAGRGGDWKGKFGRGLTGRSVTNSTAMAGRLGKRV